MARSAIITDDNFRGLIRTCLADLPHTNADACNIMQTWDVSRVTDCSLLFWEDLRDQSAWKLSAGAELFNVDISAWDTSACTTMHGMFHGASTFNQPIGRWNVSNVTDMARLFQEAKQFRQELTHWDTAKVTDMSHMFRYAETFAPAQPLAWNVAQVRSFEYMFHDALEFNNGAIARWLVTGATDEENVDDDQASSNSLQWAFKGMFDGATSFNVDISDWDITGARSLAFMFRNARSFDHDLSRWNIERVTTMTAMFEGASSFGQTLCWDISSDGVPKKVDRLLEGTKPIAKVDEHVFQCTRNKKKLEGNSLQGEAAAMRQEQPWSFLLLGATILGAVLLLWIVYQYCFQRRCCRRNKKIVIKKTARRKRRNSEKTGHHITNYNPDMDEEVFFGETDAEINLQEGFHREEEFYRSQKRHHRESVHFLDGGDEGEISFDVNSDDDAAEEGADPVADAAHPSVFADGFLFSQNLLSLLMTTHATTELVAASDGTTMEGLSLQARTQGQDDGILC